MLVKIEEDKEKELGTPERSDNLKPHWDLNAILPSSLATPSLMSITTTLANMTTQRRQPALNMEAVNGE